MARIRTIKPEFWTSEQVAECSTNARLMFVGLWNFCDDAGRHPASVRRLKMEIFPADSFTSGELQAWMDELIKVGLVRQYEAENAKYWEVTGWKKHQKIDRPTVRHPSPPAEISPPPRRTFDEDSTSVRGKVDEPSPPEGNGREGSLREWNGKEDSSKPQSDSKPAFLIFPTVGNGPKEWGLLPEKVAEYRESFPGVDVEGEARKALQWVKDNPSKRKTAKGMPAFLGRWMARVQDSGRAGGNGRPTTAMAVNLDFDLEG